MPQTAPTTGRPRARRAASPARAACLAAATLAAAAGVASGDTLSFTFAPLDFVTADGSFESFSAEKFGDVVDARGGVAAQGYDVDANRNLAGRWDVDGQLNRLGDTAVDPTGTNTQFVRSAVNGLNAAGVGVGTADHRPASDPDAVERSAAVRWAADGSASFLGGSFTTGVQSPVAQALNDGGTAVGSAVFAEPNRQAQRAVSWDAAGNLTRIDKDVAGLSMSSSRALDVNEAGTAVGDAVFTGNDGERKGPDGLAVKWDRFGVATRLGELEGGITQDSSATAVNEDGEAVGTASVTGQEGRRDDVTRAVRWDADGDAEELGGFAGDDRELVSITPVGIDDAGRVAGAFSYGEDDEDDNPIRYFALWDAGSTAATLLDSLIKDRGLTVLNVFGIDSDGDTIRIAVQGRTSGDPFDSGELYLLTSGAAVSPVPEPLTALGGAGLLSLVISRRPRRAARA